MGDGKFTWFAGRGKDPESYQINEDTREAAIQAARNDGYDEDGFTIVEADRSVMVPHFDSDLCVERIMEEICDNNCECFSEDGPEDPWSRDAEAERDLTQSIERTVEEWLERHPGKTWAFGTQRNEEYFPPAQQEAA